MTEPGFRIPSQTASKFAISALALFGFSAAASAQQKPDAVRALEAQGVTIVGTFPTAGGVPAWAGYAGQQPLALYVLPDGKHVVAGTLLDSNGQDVDHGAVEAAIKKPISAEGWDQLERSQWIADGSDKAARIVYVFTDPNCPFCNKLWADSRPWVDAGKVQLRHILVAVLAPSSPGKAAAIFADKNPSLALAAHEKANAQTNAKQMAAGHVQPLGELGIKALSKIPPEATVRLDRNVKLMASMRLEATPGLVWKDSAGVIQARAGAPASALGSIFGPR